MKKVGRSTTRLSFSGSVPVSTLLNDTFILCSLSNLDSALEKGGGDFGGELFSSRLLSRLVYLIDIIMIN